LLARKEPSPGEKTRPDLPRFSKEAGKQVTEAKTREDGRGKVCRTYHLLGRNFGKTERLKRLTRFSVKGPEPKTVGKAKCDARRHLKGKKWVPKREAQTETFSKHKAASVEKLVDLGP